MDEMKLAKYETLREFVEAHGEGIDEVRNRVEQAIEEIKYWASELRDYSKILGEMEAERKKETTHDKINA